MTSIVKGLFGGRSSAEGILQRFNPAGFSAPGLSGRFDRGSNQFVLNRTGATNQVLQDIRSGFAGRAGAARAAAGEFAGLRPELQGVRERLQGISPELSELRGEIGDLRGELRPGFGRLTRERIEGIRAQRGRAVGNLREELSRRRVLGSSFAAREVGALESEFARQEDLARAESFMQELQAQDQLIAQELGILGQEAGLETAQAGIVGQEAGLVGAGFEALTQAFDSSIAGAQAELQQLNMETGLAAGLSQTASQLINSNLTAQAQARAAQEAGAAEFLGTIIGAFVPGGD